MEFYHKSGSLKYREKSGFTLIEVAIVIVIIGLMLSAGLAYMKVTNGNRGLNTTRENLHKAELALKAFQQMNGSYPCPASRDAKSGNPAFGKALSDCVLTTERTPSTANKGKLLSDGTITATGRNQNNIRIGILPFRSLGIPDGEALDGWGRLLQYAITEKMTNPNSFRQKAGAIDVVAEDNQSRLNPPGSVQYVILSTGPDGVGGYSDKGMPMGTCPKDVLETENCDDDAIFMDAPLSVVTPATTKNAVQGKNSIANFDDHLLYQQYDATREEKSGILFYYFGSCQAGFEEIALDKNTRVKGIERISKHSPTSSEYYSDMGPGKEKLCSSSRFSQTITVSINIGARTVTSCPVGWSSIGYGVYPREAAAQYEVCAR